jgi:hypothetical protein
VADGISRVGHGLGGNAEPVAVTAGMIENYILGVGVGVGVVLTRRVVVGFLVVVVLALFSNLSRLAASRSSKLSNKESFSVTASLFPRPMMLLYITPSPISSATTGSGKQYWNHPDPVQSERAQLPH